MTPEITPEAAFTLLMIGMLFGMGLGVALGIWIAKDVFRDSGVIARVDSVIVEPHFNSRASSRKFTREEPR